MACKCPLLDSLLCVLALKLLKFHRLLVASADMVIFTYYPIIEHKTRVALSNLPLAWLALAGEKSKHICDCNTSIIEPMPHYSMNGLL